MACVLCWICLSCRDLPYSLGHMTFIATFQTISFLAFQWTPMWDFRAQGQWPLYLIPSVSLLGFLRGINDFTADHLFLKSLVLLVTLVHITNNQPLDEPTYLLDFPRIPGVIVLSLFPLLTKQWGIASSKSPMEKLAIVKQHSFFTNFFLISLISGSLFIMGYSQIF